MTELWIVLQRELLARVRSRSFVVSTLLTPAILSLFLLIPRFSGAPPADEEPRLAVVDESGHGIGEALARALAAPAGSAPRVEVTRRPWGAVQDSLGLLLTGSALDGVLRIPPGVLEGGTASYAVRDAHGARLEGALSLALSAVVTRSRLQEAGVETSVAARLLQPVSLRTTRTAGLQPPAGDDEARIVFSLMVGAALYFLILLYGVQVLQSVQEEKTNRIAEVLVSSMSASHLMLGKVFGVGIAALLQVAIWVALALLAVTQREVLTPLLGPSSELLGILRLPTDAGAIAPMVSFGILGFFLYASLFAAAGAAAASTEDAQRFTLPLVTPLLIPIFVAEVIVASPNGSLATTLGWFPLTSPVVMPMRIGAAALDPPEVWGSLLVLLAAVFALGVLAGKVYRVGILSTGKRPSLRELARWVRTA